MSLPEFQSFLSLYRDNPQIKIDSPRSCGRWPVVAHSLGPGDPVKPRKQRSDPQDQGVRGLLHHRMKTLGYVRVETMGNQGWLGLQSQGLDLECPGGSITHLSIPTQRQLPWDLLLRQPGPEPADPSLVLCPAWSYPNLPIWVFLFPLRPPALPLEMLPNKGSGKPQSIRKILAPNEPCASVLSPESIFASLRLSLHCLWTRAHDFC